MYGASLVTANTMSAHARMAKYYGFDDLSELCRMLGLDSAPDASQWTDEAIRRIPRDSRE